MDREVFLVWGTDEVRLGTVQQVLKASQEYNGEARHTLALAVSDLLSDHIYNESERRDAMTFRLEIR